MLSWLKNHPFPIEAFFEQSLVLTYALPAHELQPLIPECLVLDTFKERWGFIAIAVVKATALRPKGFPAFTGNDFTLIGYRIFTRYTNAAGQTKRGLYIIRTETDKRRMQLLGNLFTHYNYNRSDIQYQLTDKTLNIIAPGLRISASRDATDAALPAGSPFADWKEARRFAGPMPYTFSFLKQQREVLLVKGIRNNWQPRPVTIYHQQCAFLARFDHAVLANAFLVERVPYQWEKGKRESWKGQDFRG